MALATSMRQTGSRLPRVGGKCAWNRFAINGMRKDLVFRRAEYYFARKPNEISAFGPEHVFRHAPGQFVQKRGQALVRGMFLAGPFVEAAGGGVLRVGGAPLGLGPLVPRRFAGRIVAGPLAGSHPHVGQKPAAADRAGLLAGLGHGDPLSPQPGVQLRAGWVTFGEQRWVNSRERRRNLGSPRSFQTGWSWNFAPESS